MKPLTADELRRAFLDFFEQRGHTVVPSSSLIPNDPTLLLTTAGMVQFKPYMLGEQTPPWPRATSVQKCFRTTDIDIVGTTTRHLTFFEMLGNFSLGDYFKEGAIPLAWEFVTDVLGFDPDRLWVTVFEADDEAAQLWRDRVGVSGDRIQRRGEADNFWAMGPTGPCGPCSEIFYDRGPGFGDEGGPAHGGEERYLEVWNLVFMQYSRDGDGALHELPKKNIDTGAGLERLLAVLQGDPSVFETDVLRRILGAAEQAMGHRYGDDTKADVSLRIVAEHGRAATFLVSDGVFPSNEDRGYVLRRIIRRAVRHAVLLGVDEPVMDRMVEATVETMASAYPDLAKNLGYVRDVVSREEERFRRTLHRGLEELDELLRERDVSGEEAFFLHDTLGFPIDLTREIAGERGRSVELDRFEELMAEQRRRAKEARETGEREVLRAGAPVELYRALVDERGPTDFTGYSETVTEGARVVGLLADGRPAAAVREGSKVEVVLDRTPFYAEAGGQVGDVGVLEARAGNTVVRVHETAWAVPGVLIVHRAEVEHGELAVGDEVVARIDATRRDRIRRNHTGTHILHWALREVLGEHVRQQGSLVAPDRLRFDFSHYEAVSPSTLADVEAVANEEVLGNGPVHIYETTREHAESIGAIAFFGEKYGDIVRVVEAGEHSRELCGGTHVHALGSIGPVKVLAESSIGANIRRIEALTGEASLAHAQSHDELLRTVAATLNVATAEVPQRVERLLDQVRSLQEQLDAFRSQQATAEARLLAQDARDGVVVARRDGLTNDEARRLATAVRDALGSGIVVVLGQAADPTKAVLAAAVSRDLQARGVSAAAIAAPAAEALGGGTARNPDVVVGGGKRPEALDQAVELARSAAHAARGDA